MTTTVAVLAGERTIGGTIIAVEDGGASLFFDCGLAYSPATYPFAYVEPNAEKLLRDLIVLGMAPYVEGLWRQEFIAGVNTIPVYRAGPQGAAVAISHSHLDHTFFVNYVDPSIPVYASPPTTRIVDVLIEDGELSGPKRLPSVVEPGGAFQIGSMTVEMLAIDHDLPGACAFLIETSEGAILYSGDFRLHGRHPEWSLAVAETARRAGARLLILEGTGVRPPEEPVEGEVWVQRNESEVVPEIADALAGMARQLGIVLLTAENAERVEELAGAAADIGRLLVLDPTMVEVSKAALGRDLAVPYGVLPGADVSSRPVRDEAADGRIVTKDAIASSPGSFVLSIPFRRFEELIELLPHRNGGMIIASNGLPLGPFDPAWTHLEWWAKAFELGLLKIGSTGHAYPRDLATFAERTGASTVMAIHSHYPELMPIAPEKLLLPLRGRRYELADLPERRA